MRPRKLIYIFSADEQLAGEWAYIVKVRPAYRPMTFIAHQDLIAAFVRKLPKGLLVLAPTLARGVAILKLIEAVSADVRAIVVVPDALSGGFGGRHQVARESDRARIFELLHLLSARKRGPKRGLIRKPPQSDSAASEGMEMRA